MTMPRPASVIYGVIDKYGNITRRDATMLWGKSVSQIATQDGPVVVTITGMETCIKQGNDLVKLDSMDAARELAQDILAGLEELEKSNASG